MGRFTIRFVDDKDLSIAEYSGACTVEDVANGIKQYSEGRVCKYAIIDFTKVASPVAKVTGKEISYLAECMRKASIMRQPDSYDLFVVSDALMHGLARMYAAYLNHNAKTEISPKTEVFHSLEEALQWVDTHILQKDVLDT